MTPPTPSRWRAWLEHPVLLGYVAAIGTVSLVLQVAEALAR